MDIKTSKKIAKFLLPLLRYSTNAVTGLVREGARSWTRKALITDQFRSVGGSKLFPSTLLDHNIWRSVGNKPIMPSHFFPGFATEPDVVAATLGCRIPPLEKVQDPSGFLF